MFQILAINPGSTSTKVGLFEDEAAVFNATLEHSAEELERFKDVSDQKSYRMEKILEALKNTEVDLAAVDAFVGRGGALESVPSGTYRVNPLMYEHARIGYTAKHPARLGLQIAADLGIMYGKPAFIVNPPSVDEFSDIARISGLKGIYRPSRTHALNQKEVGIRYAKRHGKRYQEINLIIAHLGGGISVVAHQNGKMIDANDCLGGSGPFAPTRCGTLPALELMGLCYSGKYTEREMYRRMVESGGLVSHLGTSDIREVRKRITQGDTYAALIMDAMIYQIEKEIGAMAAVLKGKVDAILITGGASKDRELSDTISRDVRFLAPVEIIPGEMELEAMVGGVLRVLRREEKALEYTGQPVFQPGKLENADESN